MSQINNYTNLYKIKYYSSIESVTLCETEERKGRGVKYITLPFSLINTNKKCSFFLEMFLIFLPTTALYKVTVNNYIMELDSALLNTNIVLGDVHNLKVYEATF